MWKKYASSGCYLLGDCRILCRRLTNWKNHTSRQIVQCSINFEFALIVSYFNSKLNFARYWRTPSRGRGGGGGGSFVICSCLFNGNFTPSNCWLHNRLTRRSIQLQKCRVYNKDLCEYARVFVKCREYLCDWVSASTKLQSKQLRGVLLINIHAIYRVFQMYTQFERW